MLAELLDAGGLKAEDHVKYIVTKPCGSALLCSALPRCVCPLQLFECGPSLKGVCVGRGCRCLQLSVC